MFLAGIQRLIKSVLITSVITSAVFLWPAKSAFAVASIALDQDFTSADSARANLYMDSGGTWNGSNEITATGDNFVFQLSNLASNADIAGNTAYDISINLTVAQGIKLPVSPFNVTVSSTQLGGTACPNLGSVNATQALGPSTPITINVSNNTNIRPQCRYDFDFDLSTNNNVPHTPAGSASFNYVVSWANQDGSAAPIQGNTFAVPVRTGALTLTKTPNTPIAVDGTPVTYDVVITNTGNGGLFESDFTDTPVSNFFLDRLVIQLPSPFAPPQPADFVNVFSFDYLAPGQSVTIRVEGDADVSPDDTSCNIENSADIVDRTVVTSTSDSGIVPYDATNLLSIAHDLTNSFCELCAQGEVIIRVANTGGVTLNNVIVTENLSTNLALPTGLTYVPNSVTFTTISGVGAIAPFEPTLSGANNSILSWNLGTLDSPADGTLSNPIEVEIRFNIQRAAGLDEEGLADPNTVDRSIEAIATYESVCGNSAAPISTGIGILNLRQPLPTTTKLGWNVDAGQTEATAAAFAYGHEDDNIIWRVEVANGGLSDLEDLMVEDTIATGGNFTFTAVCQTAGDATNAANGTIAGSCVARGPGLSAAPPFLPPPNPGIDVPQGGSGFVYYVGTILGACTNAINNTNIEWGCDVDGTDGGIDSTNSSVLLANTLGSAGLSTDVSGAGLPGSGIGNELDVQVAVTGTNTAQPVGSRGRVTITITNDTGGTLQNLTMTDILPAEYVVDPSIPNVVDTASTNPAFSITMIPANGVANYAGMIDRVTWTNPAAIAAPLINTAPQFTLDSTTTGDAADAFSDDLLRHGDQLIITFDIVLVDASRYDLVADLDIRQETSPATDPDNTFDITNQLTVNFEEACSTPEPDSMPGSPSDFTANPEDLDVDIVGTNLSFIINTDPNIELPLTVRVTNNGGHQAENYFLIVTFGAAMEVNSSPGGGVCTDISGTPLPRPYWDAPDPIPVNDSPTIFQCDSGIIQPGSINYAFTVSRPSPASAIDDLTFRVDVVGEIQLADGTPLIFPAVAVNPPAQINNVANNYSLDAIRARVIGFGLVKSLVGTCTEQLSFPARTADSVFIGEDCQFNILSGGWFGFDTPGFGIIAVHTISVDDEIPTAATPVNPSAQGYISNTNGAASDTEILNSGIAFTPAGINQLDQGTVTWTFNVPNGGTSPNDNKLYVRDRFFNTNITTRILNEPLDLIATPPNQHNQLSRNILNTTFSADFVDTSGTPGVFTFNQNTVGYPAENLRRYDLTITEPNLIITKDVCNETLTIGGFPNCIFTDSVSNGDTEDFYVYRITITNPATAPGATRAPAYNVVISDLFDDSDLMQVWPITPVVNPLRDPFDNDGLDNDGDGLIDAADPNGEAEILTDNMVNILPAIPVQIKFSYRTSVALEQIDQGETVELFYRVNPDDFIAPLQILTNTLDVRFDTLAGLAGSQNAVQFPVDPHDFPAVYPASSVGIPAGSAGSARVYTVSGETARVQILPLAVERKIIVQTSLQPGAGPLPAGVELDPPTSITVDVVVGEEVEYKLRTLIPVANLRQFMVRDELPPGISCVEAPPVNLNLPPYDVAGFVPGGIIIPTCNDNLVEWDFGDQELTASLGNNRFPFEVGFIGRVQNIPTTLIRPFVPNVNNCILRNGGGAMSWGAAPPTSACNVDTFVRTSYSNATNVLIEHLFDPIQVMVREPQLEIVKTFVEVASGNPGVDETIGDAKDIFEVRVDITNVGDAIAYNPQILDNLQLTKYTYLANVGSDVPANIPVSDGIALPLPGTNQPVFSWDPTFNIAIGNTISFNYRVEANDDVEPLEDVVNTNEAKWTSLQSQNIALNTSNAIGPDGDVLGMRNGYFASTEPAPANPPNDYIFAHSDSIVIPGLVVTKTDLDAGTTIATIGAQKQFQIDIDLPEGLTNNVLINDNLAFGDVPPAPIQTYILENATPFLVQYEFFGIRSINGIAPTPANAETIFNTVPVNGTANNAIWDIGLVQTETEDDSALNPGANINPRIRITYFALVNNDLATNNLDLLQNQATLQYTSGLVPPTTEIETDETAAITVIEPDLIATKVADNFSFPGIDPDAGDELIYTVTINHSGISSSPAYDLNVIDVLPPNVSYVPNSAVLLINGAAVGMQEPTVNMQQLIWGRDNANDELLDIPLGQILLLTYRVLVLNTVQPLETITNSVVLDWTSLDGSSAIIDARERFGIGGVDCTFNVGDPNDYCFGPVTTTLNVIDKNLVVKTKSNDSYLPPAIDTDLRIGDIVEYTLTLSLQDGTTRALTLVDTLPNGVRFIDVTSVNGQGIAPYNSANGFIHDPIAAPLISGPNNKTITWTIGSALTGIINTPNDGFDDFVIVYRGVVTNTEFVKPQVATLPANNTVVMNYIDVNGNPPTGPPLSRLTSTVNLNVQQPIIFLADLTKERRNGVSVSGNPVVPNEVLDFRLEACNVGTAPAYNLILEDVIPQYFPDPDPLVASPLLDIATLTVPIVRINNAIVNDGAEYIYTAPPVSITNPTEILRISFTDTGPLPAGQCATIEFDIDVHDQAKAQLNWNNIFQLIEYYSLPAVDANADVLERQIYDAQGPVLYNLNTVVPIINPNKDLLTPIGPNYEATIGESITYQIRVPGDPSPVPPPIGGPMQVNMFNVNIVDQLSVNTTLVNPLIDVVLDPLSQYTGGFTVSVDAANLMTINVPLIPFDGALAVPGTQQAIFNVTVRVNNDVNTSSTIAPVTMPFNNSVNFSFGGLTTGIGITANAVNIVEPQLTLDSKQGLNLTQAAADTNAGDIIRYTLTINSLTGAPYSDAFDVNIVDTLSASLQFCSATVDGGLCEDPTISNGTPIAVAPTLITGNGSLASPFVLNWNSVNGSPTNIDIVEGDTVTITYTVRVMDNVLALQPLVNTATISWTSLDGIVVGERDGLVANTPSTHLYVSGPQSSPILTVPDINDLTKLLDSATSTPILNATDHVRVGDIVDYELRILLQEGTSANTILTDTLPQGLQYEGIVSINNINTGTFTAVPPFSHATYTQGTTVVVGDPRVGPSVVTWTMGDIINAGNNVTIDDEFVIIYRTRVIELVNGRDLANPANNIPLQNNIGLVYNTAIGQGSDLNNVVNIAIDQPNLSVVKSLPGGANVVIEANDVVTFYVDITNAGESAAYDLFLQDTLPVGLRMGGNPIVVTAIEMPIGNPIVPIPNITQNYVQATGVITWDFDTGVANELTIPATNIAPLGDKTLRIIYTVQADSNIAAGLSINNLAQVLRYHSLDNQELPIPVTPAPGIVPPVVGVREIYGPSNVASIALTTAGPGALDKVNPILPAGSLGVSIGQPFDYAITVPAVPLNTTLYDIRILDNLNAIPATDLIYVDVQPVTPGFVPVNTGTPFEIVIEDVTNGIDIVPMQNAQVALTVMLRNTPNNVSGNTFSNTADYTFNSVKSDDASQGAGMPDTTMALTIVEPVLEITKVGPPPPSIVLFNTPIPYAVTVVNAGNGPAYDTTITDLLPLVADNPPLTGGTCNRLPENVTAQLFRDDDTPIATLVQDTDFVVVHTGAPTCTLAITTTSLLATIQYDERMEITYDTYLDIDSQNNALLTNNVSVTRYFSQDTPAGVRVGEIREYLNDPNNPADESAYTVLVNAPDLLITKVPLNLTTGGPGAVADPGDVLRYTINIQNNGPEPTGVFSLSDQPDRLNPAPGYFDFSTVANVVVPVGAVVVLDGATGTINITGLSLDALGGANNSLIIEFDIQLIPVITSGITVLNQGEADVIGFSLQLTDDPAIVGDANPTETLIDAAPAFQVLKTSEDLTGDAILRQGDILRYTLQVKNIGMEGVEGTYLRDLVPANTSYVANSTTLNGTAVADIVADTSPLESEMLINAPEDLTPGAMRADPDSNVTSNVATITFDVTVDLDVVEGTVVSNQGYVGGTGSGSGSFAEQASDNPDTSLVNDPTINVVGNLPAIDAQKTVALFTDVAANDIVNTGDTLEYTIVVANGGAVSANATTFIDVIPANSAYVANSFSLNGIGIPDANLVSTSPLTARINSADLGLPDQAANDGEISAGNEATVRFRVVVTGPATSVISNQGMIMSNELPEQLTDSDGNSTNGQQTTDTVVGATSEMQITKEVFVVGGGVIQAGGELEYILTVSNTGLVDATNVLLVDAVPANVIYTLGSTKLDGSTAFIGSGVAEPGANLMVNYQMAKGPLEAGEKFTVSYRVVADAALIAGTEILNTATVTWTQQPSPISDNAIIEIGGAPGVGVVGGNIWHDIIRSPAGEFTAGSDINLEGWTVQIYLNNPARNLFATTLSDENGRYQFKGLPASTSGGEYELRVVPPGGSDTSASMGPMVVDILHGTNSGTLGEMSITNISLTPGSNIANQNQPVIPTGVIYDSVLRTPVAGATLNLLQANGSPVPANCLPAGSNQASQTSAVNGFYRFDIQACGITNFVIEVNGVPGGYNPGASQIIPAGKAGNADLNVPVCSDSSDDTIIGNNDCDIQFSVIPPDTSVPVRTDSTPQGVAGETQGTSYFLNMRVTNSGQVAFNNHIPLDPILTTAISISKVSSMVNVTRSQLVPYTITLSNNLSAPLYDLDVVDFFPAGFKYIAGSGRIQSNQGPWVKTEPILDANNPSNLTLTWVNIGRLNSNESFSIKLLLVVGSGVGEGEYINRAQVLNNLTGGAASGQASATVRVVPDPTFDCSDVIGKVFDDKNLNAYQDEGEAGIAGARVVTAKGLEITADAYGRFHLTCAVVPNPDRGSNFIMKLDERSLPSGYRLTTENPRVVRATRGKMIKFNFGVAIHRVVRLDMADQVFEPNTNKMRPQWLPRLDILITELAKDPSMLRLSYLAENETQSQVDERLDAVKDEIEKRWEDLDCCYLLTIETEIFWRKGGPVDRGEFDD